MSISEQPDDIVAKLERLTAGRRTPPQAAAPPAEKAPEHQPSAPAAPPPGAPSAETPDARKLLREIDELREQLEGAFAESFDRLGRLEAEAEAARSQLTQALQQADDTAALVEQVRGSMATLGTLTSRSVDRIEQVDAAVRSVAERPVSEPFAVDLAPLDQRIDRLVTELGQRLAEDQARIQDSLAAITKELAASARSPVTVDTSALEDATRRGALHNAADIANLRRDVEVLAEAVRGQDKGIGEVRTTLEWIKERLLLR